MQAIYETIFINKDENVQRFALSAKCNKKRTFGEKKRKREIVLGYYTRIK